MSKREQNETNYGKIIAITLAVVSGACTIIWFALKLYRKYCLLDDFDEENGDFDFDFHNADDDCEIVYADNDSTDESKNDDASEDSFEDKEENTSNEGDHTEEEN